MPNGSWIGQALNNRYQVLELLGQGGMSSVYKANDPNLRRMVAVKMIHSYLSNNGDFMRRFEEEAAGIAQLRHPNIVQVFDFNHDGDVYYMVLEFIPGETLESRLKREIAKDRLLEVPEAIQFLAQVCDAASYAHEHGIIHRDIKPANIMIDINGKAILTDFGIARMVGGQMHTAAGAVVGTALYMAPEQIKGERVDERADIYSLGVTLFESLSGRPPFEADSAMTLMMMHLNDPVPDIHHMPPQVPESLFRVVAKALEKKREDRFQTAAEMAAALRRVYEQVTAADAHSTVPPTARVEKTQVDLPIDQTRPDLPARPDLPIQPVEKPVEAPVNQAVEIFPEKLPGKAVPSMEESPLQDQAVSTVPLAREPQSVMDPLPKRSRRIPILVGGCLLLIVICLAGTALGGYSLYQRSGIANLLTSFSPTQLVPILDSGGKGTVEALATQAATLVPTGGIDISSLQTPVAETLVAAINLTPSNEKTPLADAQTTPSATDPVIQPGQMFVRIDSITIENGRYVVDYETIGFKEKLPGTHIHFFFNTVPPDQAGVPGIGPWVLYGGPIPFRGFTVANRPAKATQMCTLVANPDHSVQPGSGNCFDLPK